MNDRLHYKYISCGFWTEPTSIRDLYFVKLDMPALASGSISVVPFTCKIHYASLFCDLEIINNIPNNGI